ncbi:MAG: cytochrome c oxidase subunit II [Alphaproteobacteria bacterium]|nr:cytochrome c oxidase subunit II [Alphaproteobacteria bacterium]
MAILTSRTGFSRFLTIISVLSLVLLHASGVHAQEIKDWQLGFQQPVTPVMEQLEGLHDLLLVVITGITLFVMGLLGYTCWRFSAKRNPVPSKTTHNTMIEVIWTVIPALILVVVAIPTFKLLYYMNSEPEADMTLKVIGHQWYWEYEYPEHGIRFDSYLVEEKDLKPGQPRLLDVDNHIVVPVDTTVRVLITAADVIHAFTMPAFGIKTDAVPGHLNQTWFRAEKTGTYRGQCSELCGVRHGYMPIVIDVVGKEEYAQWLAEHKPAAAAPEVAAPETVTQ